VRPLVLTLLALLAGGGSLPVRAAGPADDAGHPANGWSEEWRVIAFDRATHGSVAISLVARPIPWLEVQVRQGAKTWAADAELPNGLLDHRGPGVTIANLPDNAPPQTNSLSYSRGKYVVDLTWPARGRVTVTPVRLGVVVGPWHLGKERVLPAKPPAFVPGTMIWSVPVALGTASGSIEAYGHRIAFHGWQAYHDRTWGRFRLGARTRRPRRLRLELPAALVGAGALRRSHAGGPAAQPPLDALPAVLRRPAGEQPTRPRQRLGGARHAADPDELADYHRRRGLSLGARAPTGASRLLAPGRLRA